MECTSENQNQDDNTAGRGPLLGTHNPWLNDATSFHEKVIINKSDLLLPSVVPKYEDGCLIMPAEACMPIEKTWGFCLLGFYGGRFPGKEATQRAVSRWSRRCKLSFHPSGWIIFRFATEEDREVMVVFPDLHETKQINLRMMKAGR